MKRPRVEVLYVRGCPHREGARALVERVARDLSLTPAILLVEVPDPGAASRLRFLGSPTIRVDGHDVEPAADDRTDFSFACRIYRSEQGFSAQPAEAWVRRALTETAS